MIKKEFFLNYKLPKNTVFLDIETTGFSKEDSIICICYATYFNDKKCKLIQLISTNQEYEILDEDLLSYFYEDILGYYKIYTFNGYEFEEKILQNHKLDFSNFLCQSLKKNIKNFANILKLDKFSREDIENYFGLVKNRYYDMNRIVKKIRKQKYLDDFIIEHNIEEITTLIQIYTVFSDIKKKNNVKINETIYYLDDFNIVQDTISMSFVSSKKYKHTKYYMQNPQKILALQNDIKIEILTKKIQKEDEIVILYELEKEYIPIVIKNEIIYQNIYFILESFLKYIDKFEK